jgi:DNA primase
MNTTDFLSQLQGVKNNGNGQYMALCPGHSDHEPSLSVKEAALVGVDWGTYSSHSG